MASSSYEVEVTVTSARDLKNVNWKHGDLCPYAILWVDHPDYSAAASSKVSTRVDVDNGENPVWDEKLTIPLPGYDRRSVLDDAVLCIDVVHADADDDVKPLVGSARLPLVEIVDEAGLGGRITRTLKLKRPSGRPQGKLEVDVKVCARELAPRHYEAPPQPYGMSYGQLAPPAAGYPYGAAPPAGYPYGAPPSSGYPYGAPTTTGYPYGAPPPGGYPYGGAPPLYGQGPPAAYGSTEEKKSSKFGMGTGLAVGAAAGVLGGLALAEGVDYVEDQIADDVAEKVEDDLGDYGGDDDF